MESRWLARNSREGAVEVVRGCEVAKRVPDVSTDLPEALILVQLQVSATLVSIGMIVLLS